ncbi:reverse transcriptase [Gossypium australe]|uniref:Reverse transcriptase n=1 Tax=Gossypium australe TaxID=47621 RepID=A0A5B6WRV5_9ROSI|nr:reverse transcriptase [Gossypium australe]
MDELAFVDIKPEKWWFTWVNNRSGGSIIKERLARFLCSVSVIEKFPFMTTSVVRQTKSDHDAIILDMWGRKPKEYPKDPRLCFKFDDCWATDREAKNFISSAWNKGVLSYVEKIDSIRSVLGPWQRDKYGKMKREIRKLEQKIDMFIDSSQRVDSANPLKETRCRPGHLYAKEEKYWAQRSRSQWLREEDRNTQYFHARATSRFKKNNIDKLKYLNGNWVTDNKDICNVAKDYCRSCFDQTECVTKETNEWLIMDYTESEVTQAIKQMDPRKAPLIDGLPGSFFKYNWETVKNDTIRFCLDVLNGNKDIFIHNDTIIILIPKIWDPCDITNFCPISLCRFIYKIISKVLANRLKVALLSFISEN